MHEMASQTSDMARLHCEGFVADKVVSSPDSVKLICLFNIAIANVTKVEWVKTGVGPVAAMYVEDGRIQSVTFGYAIVTLSSTHDVYSLETLLYCNDLCGR